MKSKNTQKRLKSASKRNDKSPTTNSKRLTSSLHPPVVSSPNKHVRFDNEPQLKPRTPAGRNSAAVNPAKDSHPRFFLPRAPVSSSVQAKRILKFTGKVEDVENFTQSSTGLDRRVRASRRNGTSSFSKINLSSHKGFHNIKQASSSQNIQRMRQFTPNYLTTSVSDSIINDTESNQHDGESQEGSEESESEYEDFDSENATDTDDDEANGTSDIKDLGSKENKKPFSPPPTLNYLDFEDVCHVGEDGIWNDYEVGKDEHLPNWKSRSIDTLFQSADFRALAPLERRVQIEDLKFKVVHNSSFDNSLLRAVSLAVTGSESNLVVIRRQILKELMENWALYFLEMCEECRYDVSSLPSITNPTDFLRIYKEHYSLYVSEPPVFHLQAAASRVGFSFVFFDASNYNANTVTVLNSRNPVNLKLKDVYVYHFIRTGSEQGTWTYEFMIPLGRPSASTYLQDGSYSIKMFDTLLVDRQSSRPIMNERRISTDERIQLSKKPLTVFGLDHRMFAYRPTYSSDLWSLLSELLTGRLSNAPVILRECLRERYFQAQYYHFSKVRKRRQVKGNSRQDDLDREFKKRTYVPRDHRGSIEDLEHAATAFQFSFVLIGMDSNGNFFSKENIISQVKEKSIKLAFFVAFTTNKKPYWHALEEISTTRSSKSQHFADTTFTDDTTHMRSLYCRTQPCLVVHKVPSWGPRNAIVSLRSQFVNGKNAIVKGLGIALSPVNNVIQRVSEGSLSTLSRFTRRIRDIRRFWDKRNRVEPVDDDDISIKQLYLRENP